MLRDRALRAALATASLLLACFAAEPVYATCTSPAGNEGDQVYNYNYHTFQFCNGTSWLAYGGGSNCTASGSYSPTTPSHSGYFVLSGSTYNGNLSGLIGADAVCLSDLTTNTGWAGYSTANSNGQLVASKVHAFLCLSGGTGTVCNNLMPLTTYYFANAGNSSAGGASFTTDLNGIGPNDSANWSALNYFDGSYNYWTDRESGTNTAWINGSQGTIGCNSWATSSSGSDGVIGNSSQTTSLRWMTGSTSTGCNTTLNIICYVNP